MGIYDRDYYRKDRGAAFGRFVPWSMTIWLIALNVGVFFVDAAAQRLEPTDTSIVLDDDGLEHQVRLPPQGPGPLARWGAMTIRDTLYRGQLWRPITYQFLHANGWHLAVNMVGPYFFGPIVEGHFGSRRFAAFYMLCGLAGAVCFIAMVLLRVLNLSVETPLVGASAGLFGLLVAAAIIAPDVEIFYYLVPITIRILAIFMLLAAAAAVVKDSHNAGGEAAHLGGGAVGFVLMKNQHWLAVFSKSRSPYRAIRRGPRRAFGQKDWSKDLNR